MQSANFSSLACASDAPLEFTFIQSSGSSEIIAGPEYLCRTGVNDVIFDVGTYDANSFLPTVSNAFTLSVTVMPGEFKYFLPMNFAGSFVVQSYALIDSLEILFLDSGLNEVSGNATMSLMSVNASAVVYPAVSFSLVSNMTSKAYVRAFYLYVTDWLPSETPLKIGLIATNSSVMQYGSSILTLMLNHSCSPGYHVILSSYDDMYFQLSKQGPGAFLSKCAQCLNGSISTRNDALVCRSVVLIVFHLCQHLYVCPAHN
jgi:hypothetical protein